MTSICNSRRLKFRLACALRISCVALIVAAVTGSGVAAEIIAHRGASFDAPENTLSAIRLAWQQQTDAVEIDVYLTKDSRIVLMHDKTAKRTGGVDHKLADMTWPEIRQLDVGAWKDPRFAGEKVPLLSEALATIPQGHRIFIEIKSGPEIVPELKRVLEEANRPAGETCIICFNKEVIAATAKELPNLKSYWLVSLSDKPKKPNLTAEQIIKTARQLGADGVDVGGRTTMLTAEMVQKFNQARLPCYTWTVDDVKEAKRLADIGVVGITTNKPATLKKAGVDKITPGE